MCLCVYDIFTFARCCCLFVGVGVELILVKYLKSVLDYYFIGAVQCTKRDKECSGHSRVDTPGYFTRMVLAYWSGCG